MRQDSQIPLSMHVEGHGWVPSGMTSYLGRPFIYPTESILGLHIAGGNQWDDIFRLTLPALLPQRRPTICEVGSNIGASLLQILAAKPEAHVFALEPCDLFRPYLGRNLELAGYRHQEILPLLAGAENKDTHLHHDMSSGSPNQAGNHMHHQSARMTTLDALFADGPVIDLIKVDTDGFDFEVLHGAEAILRRDRPILHFEFVPELMRTNPADELAWLRTLGYERLACLHPVGLLVEVTEDPLLLARWADKFTYCDLLGCATGSIAKRRFDELIRRSTIRPWQEVQQSAKLRLRRWLGRVRRALR